MQLFERLCQLLIFGTQFQILFRFGLDMFFCLRLIVELEKSWKKIVKVHEVGHKFIMYIYQEIQKLIKKCHKKYRMAKKGPKMPKISDFVLDLKCFSVWLWSLKKVGKKIVKVLQSKPQMMSIIPFAYFVSFFMLVLCTNNFLCDLANVKQTLLNQGLNIQIFCFLDEKNVFKIRKKTV